MTVANSLPNCVPSVPPTRPSGEGEEAAAPGAARGPARLAEAPASGRRQPSSAAVSKALAKPDGRPLHQSPSRDVDAVIEMGAAEAV